MRTFGEIVDDSVAAALPLLAEKTGIDKLLEVADAGPGDFVEVQSWSEMWPTTAGPFGGIGGQSFTSFYVVCVQFDAWVVVCVSGQAWRVGTLQEWWPRIQQRSVGRRP